MCVHVVLTAYAGGVKRSAGGGHNERKRTNLDGASKAFINKGQGPKGNTLRLPDTVKSLNALIEYAAGGNAILHRQVIAGQGLGSDQTRTVFLPQKTKPTISIDKILYQDGTIYEDVE